LFHGTLASGNPSCLFAEKLNIHLYCVHGKTRYTAVFPARFPPHKPNDAPRHHRFMRQVLERAASSFVETDHSGMSASALPGDLLFGGKPGRSLGRLGWRFGIKVI